MIRQNLPVQGRDHLNRVKLPQADPKLHQQYVGEIGSFRLLIVLAICKPGYYSTNNGISPCVQCPMGTYQDNDQQTKCKSCPAGTNTASTGSTSQKDCLSPVRITTIIPTSDYTTYENEAISLACYIAGDPTPCSVKWTKVGGSLPSSDRLAIKKAYDLDNKLAGVEYIISGAVVADSGIYECKTSNKHGSVTKQVRITVLAGSPPGTV
ncbi:Basement membrane-specific heparan sulfate proteoglycan core protein [Desmophyllum pertusum]|uniref:Basement membrane-specific heparan sulfate proteoglycan core protein n=1 Tax=Desmophyllum pertusum TaxID=174260 RepID=A0A9W9ZGM5_9CNID|nr:Basement membrane-specific heparan sulfate proteoglycan core protein [Desmophyllum pertusum]